MRLPCQGLVEHCDVPILLVKGEMEKSLQVCGFVTTGVRYWERSRARDGLVTFVVLKTGSSCRVSPRTVGREEGLGMLEAVRDQEETGCD